MEPKQRLLLTLSIGIILVFGFYFISNAITKYTGFFVSDVNHDEEYDLAVCLQEQDISLYINTENTASTLKNIELVDYLEYIKIKNCLRNNQECLDSGVDSFPTWIINNNKVERDISFEELSQYSGCRWVVN